MSSINRTYCEQYLNLLFEFEGNSHPTKSSYKPFLKTKLFRTKLKRNSIYFTPARLSNTNLSADILPENVESLSASQLSAFHRFRDRYLIGNNDLINCVFTTLLFFLTIDKCVLLKKRPLSCLLQDAQNRIDFHV